MAHYVGLDLSKHTAAVCVVNAAGAVVQEGVVAADVRAIVAFLRGSRRRYSLVGLEAGAGAPGICNGLIAAGLPAICVDPYYAHQYLKAGRRKTDVEDARGMAHLLRINRFLTVHVKAAMSRRLQSMLTARAQLAKQSRALKLSIGGLFLTFGLKLEAGKPSTFLRRARELARTGRVGDVLRPLLDAWEATQAIRVRMDAGLKAAADADPVCSLLASTPGVGWLTALTFHAIIDDPRRFRCSRDVGSYLGLTPKVWQTGGQTWRGRITRDGNQMCRVALVVAAYSLLRGARGSDLQAWGRSLAARQGKGKAAVAVARKLAVILHRMWISGRPFEWGAAREPGSVAATAAGGDDRVT